MRIFGGLGVWLALTFFIVSSAWADCRFNDAEKLNADFTSKIIIAKSLDGWTAEMSERREQITSQFHKVSDQHSAAESADDLTALQPVCDDYRTLLVELDELTKSLE